MINASYRNGKLTRMFFGLGVLLFLVACSQSHKERGESSMMSQENSAPEDAKMSSEAKDKNDEVAGNAVSSSAAVENKNTAGRKFIRTADLKFRVKNVIESTYDIENIANMNGGFVTYTDLESVTNTTSTIPISADSLLESTWYTVTNTITLRVPNLKLDTTLKEIARNIKHFDYRIIKAEDVALQMMSNRLTQKREENAEERLANAIDNKGKKLHEIVGVEQELSDKQERADDARITNLYLDDQVKYSTVNVLIYERQMVKREVLANDNNMDMYKQPFGQRMIDALKTGWNILSAIVVFLTSIWTLIVVAGAGYFLYRKYRLKTKSK